MVHKIKNGEGKLRENPKTVSEQGTGLKSIQGDQGQELIRSQNRYLLSLRVVLTKKVEEGRVLF